jgi:hypothetical protein
MPKVRKTRDEKIKSQYRLANFSLQVKEAEVRRDKEEFSYLASEYVVRDLSKTILYTAVIVTLLVLAQRYLG